MVCLILNLDVVVAFQEDGASGPPSLDAEVFADALHPKKLLKGLNRLRLNRVLCDVILCCGGQEVSCHRHVLASFSSYFEVKVAMVVSTRDLKLYPSPTQPDWYQPGLTFSAPKNVLISWAGPSGRPI